MFCDVCGEDKENLHKFYYGFFKTEYEPEKWCLACDDCQRQFQRDSFGASYDKKQGLKKMESKIIENLEKPKVRRR